MQPSIQFIGEVYSSLKKIEDCPLQENEGAPEAAIKIFPDFLPGIRNIKEGSEILVFTWFHKADRKIIECKPRNNTNAPMTGVFATRSPDRPNPIGLHAVKVIAVSDDGTIKVSALEVLDQTPVVDIKPMMRKDFI